MPERSDKWHGSPESISYRPGTGAFVGLLLVAGAGLGVLGFFLWYIPTVGLRTIHPALPYVTAAVLIAVFAFICLGTLVIAYAVLKGRFLFYSPLMRGFLVRFFLPIMVLSGGILKIPRIRIEQTFIDLNNRLVLMMGRRLRPDKLLILMPHCIQFDNCKIKVTRNVRNCAGCGKCEIGELVSLTDEFGVSLFISTGGTVARRKVVEHRPDAVVAVACERDLTSGVQDAYPLPVLAIVNKRPHGYCMETGVAVGEVRQALKTLLGKA